MSDVDDILNILHDFERRMLAQGVKTPRAELTIKPFGPRQLNLCSATCAPAFEGEYLKCFYGPNCFIEADAYIHRVPIRKSVPCAECGAPSRVTVDTRPLCRECYAKMEFDE